MFHSIHPNRFSYVCSTLHLTALPPMSSGEPGMSGYNVQAMRPLSANCPPAVSRAGKATVTLWP